MWIVIFVPCTVNLCEITVHAQEKKKKKKKKKGENVKLENVSQDSVKSKRHLGSVWIELIVAKTENWKLKIESTVSK